MRYQIFSAILVGTFSYCQAQTPPPPGKLINLQIETTLVPKPAAVDVLLPPGYEQFSKPVPLFIWLHGGTSGKNFLGNRMRHFIETAWATKDLRRTVDRNIPKFVIRLECEESRGGLELYWVQPASLVAEGVVRQEVVSI